MGRIVQNLLEIAFVALVGWIYLTVLREPRPRVKPVGHRIPRPRRRELRKNRYVLPGEWS